MSVQLKPLTRLELSDAIRLAAPNAVLFVVDALVLELAQVVAKRMKREDISFGIFGEQRIQEHPYLRPIPIPPKGAK